MKSIKAQHNIDQLERSLTNLRKRKHEASEQLNVEEKDIVNKIQKWTTIQETQPDHQLDRLCKRRDEAKKVLEELETQVNNYMINQCDTLIGHVIVTDKSYNSSYATRYICEVCPYSNIESY